MKTSSMKVPYPHHNFYLDDEFLFDEKLNKEFKDPLENYDAIIKEADSKYERDEPR
jgi:hypothetical protein